MVNDAQCEMVLWDTDSRSGARLYGVDGRVFLV